MEVGMKDFLKLDTYLIPKIVPVIYRIGLILCIINGFIQIISNIFLADIQHYYYWIEVLLLVIFWIVIIPVILRITCEVFLILYDIYQTLLGIKSNLTHQDDKQNQAEKET